MEETDGGDGKLTTYKVGKLANISDSAAKYQLDKLHEKDLVELETVEADGEIFKRYYTLTEEGQKAVVEEGEQFLEEKEEELKAALGSFRGLKDRLEEAQGEGGGGDG